MRCKQIQELLNELWTGEVTAEVRAHLASCPACESRARNIRLVDAGFQALAAEPPPELMLGFATRVVRQWEETAEQGRRAQEFFEQVGRRFVYATLLVTLAMLLALALPASGPVRGPASADLLLAQPEVTMTRPELLGGTDQDIQDTVPVGRTSEDRKGQK
jgi:anti-sigma factor RsiW